MDKDKLVLFLYVLGRDYLPLGSIQEIITNHINKAWLNKEFENPEITIDYSNRYLADFARDIANKLK